MVTIIVPNVHTCFTQAPDSGSDLPETRGLELAAVVADTDDLTEAFDRVIHRDGENWTDNPGVLSFGDPRGRRSSQEGDVFVAGDGLFFMVLAHGFRPLPSLKLPYLS